MAYYVGMNAEATADAIWSAVGSTLGSSDNVANDAHSKNILF
jgi:hypothetical protein